MYNVLPHQLHSFIFIYCTASQLLESVVLLLVLNHSNHAYFSVQVLVLFSACVFVILQDGVNWLSFLNKYKLHGILCDDMGLGKTLQSICILAGDHYLRYRVTASAQ